MRAIALLTDFGTRDPYVAAMKGVIAARTDVPVLDLTHEIAPFDVWEAAFFLKAIVAYWQDTLFVCVVDPGVGTSRRILAVRSGGNVFLAPDNGLLTFIEGDAYAVTDQSLFLPHGSNTFHGRDRFAPVAAAIANGLTELGERVHDRVGLDYRPGTIISIDRFGNAITDIVPRDGIALRVGELVVDRVARNYAEAGEGPFLIAGSSGTLEISLRERNAAAVLGLTRGDRVEVILAR